MCTMSKLDSPQVLLPTPVRVSASLGVQVCPSGLQTHHALGDTVPSQVVVVLAYSVYTWSAHARVSEASPRGKWGATQGALQSSSSLFNTTLL